MKVFKRNGYSGILGYVTCQISDLDTPDVLLVVATKGNIDDWAAYAMPVEKIASIHENARLESVMQYGSKISADTAVKLFPYLNKENYRR